MTQPDEPGAAAAAEHAGPLLLDRNLLVIFSITLVAMMGVASITPALPAVARAYGISPREIGWLVAAFTLPGAVLTPVVGVLADRYGRKRVIVPSLLAFSLAGGACALTTGYEQLLVLRFLQGFGGAALNTLNMTLIGDLYSGHRRVTAMGYTGGFISATAAGYPLIGGALALLGWRYPFAMPVLGLPVALLVLVVLKAPATPRAVGFGAYLRKMAATLTNTDVLLLFATGFVVFLVLYGPLVTYLPFFLERRFGSTALEFGLVMAANAAAGALASVLLGWISRRASRKAILTWSLALIAVPMASIPFAPSIWAVVGASMVIGAAMGVNISMVHLLLTERAPVEQRGAIMALNGTMFRLGQTVGPLAMGLLLAAGGMAAIFTGAAILTALMLAVLAAAMTARRG